MKTVFTLTGTDHEITVTTEHSASSYGQAVAVAEDGEAIDIFSFSAHEILDATAQELDALARAGYPLKMSGVSQ